MLRPKSANEETKLKDDILARAGFSVFTSFPAMIVRRHYDDCKSYIFGLFPELRDDDGDFQTNIRAKKSHRNAARRERDYEVLVMVIKAGHIEAEME